MLSVSAVFNEENVANKASSQGKPRENGDSAMESQPKNMRRQLLVGAAVISLSGLIGAPAYAIDSNANEKIAVDVIEDPLDSDAAAGITPEITSIELTESDPFASPKPGILPPGILPGPDTVLHADADISGLSIIGVNWIAGTATEGTVAEFRTHDSFGWTAWVEIEIEDAPYNTPGMRDATAPYTALGIDQVEVRLIAPNGAPVDPQLNVISAEVTPADNANVVLEVRGDGASRSGSSLNAAGPSGRSAGNLASWGGFATKLSAPKPTIISRSAWGADERLMTWKPKSAAIYGVTVHHTAGRNDYTKAEAPALVRAIYTYHAKSNGWGDIGYNFVVDKFGNIYEGRAGGIDKSSRGAHSVPTNELAFGVSFLGCYGDNSECPKSKYGVGEVTDEMMNAAASVIAWKFAIHQVPVNSTFKTKGNKATNKPVKEVAAIHGHRDADYTTCPGNKLYALLPKLRTKVENRLSGHPDTHIPIVPVIPTGKNSTTRTVSSIQALVGASPDGIYGPDTTAKVAAWQKSNGLDVTGNWDKASDKYGFPMDFEPGNIISDSIMFNPSAMTEDQVRNFVQEQGAKCVPTAGNVCLKDYVENTQTIPQTQYCTSPYYGAENESAGTIIYKAATSCGINPQVLLVTLQKEQSLILSDQGKPATTYDRALGYRCPDPAPGQPTVCEPEFAGFSKQLYAAASRLQEYKVRPDSFPYKAGKTYQVKYHPSCSTTAPVFMANQATANLYNYTPFTPNRAALLAGSANGDSCSSTGNRNFHRYFNMWFGSPRVDEEPAVIENQGSGTVTIEGSGVPGATLFANPTQFSPEPTWYTYKWFRNNEPIFGADSQWYQVSVEDAGQQLSVTATGYGSDGNTQTATATKNMDKTEFIPGVVNIAGQVVSGATLSAQPEGFTPYPSGITYQWFRDDKVITGATGQTYELGQPDWNKRVRVKVTLTSNMAKEAQFKSIDVVVPEPQKFATVGKANLTGQPKVGAVLTATTAGFDPKPTTKTYQWLRDGAPINGATIPTYEITKADGDHKITVEVTAKALGYRDAVAVSPAKAVPPNGMYGGKVSIKGAFKVGEVVQASVSGVTPQPSDYKFTWMRGGNVVAEGATYKIKPGDKGRDLKVKVTASRPGLPKYVLSSDTKVVK
ncbi:MAG: N-acetylmuramoyl-L-alanine amidase [Cellulomonadaceae bacterium]|nr:N-acetylmuramoyl-L-alanine amidase [Cellulomonadaceae bacterium]